MGDSADSLNISGIEMPNTRQSLRVPGEFVVWQRQIARHSLCRYVVSETSVCRLVRPHNLTTSPTVIVKKAADEFRDNAQ